MKGLALGSTVALAAAKDCTITGTIFFLPVVALIVVFYSAIVDLASAAELWPKVDYY